MTRVSRTVYEADVYHDTEFDAAAESTSLGYFPTRTAAVAAVNAKRDEYWQTGGVTVGTLYEGIPGVSPEYFESKDVDATWFVGTDGKAVR